MRGDFVEAVHDLLDLRREHIHAANNEHVVGAAHDAVDFLMRTAAGALARNEARKVARAIANKRGALARERGNDELAEFAVRHRLEGVGVYDFC